MPVGERKEQGTTKSFMKAHLHVGSSSGFIRTVNHYFTHFAGKITQEIFKYTSQMVRFHI